MDKCKIGLGYNAIPPPYIGNFMPPKSDLVYPSLDDFVDESVSKSVVEKPTIETNEPETARKENRAPIIEDWVSDSDEENVPKDKTVEMFNKPSFSKIKFVKSTEQVKSPKKTSVDKNRQNTPSTRGNKRNWNQQMSQKLGSDFEMFNKACYVCGSFDHWKNDCNNWYNNGIFAKPVWTNIQKVNKQNFSKLTHPSPKRNMVPRTVLTRSGPILVNTVRPVNTVQPRTTVNNVGPIKNVINNAYSTARRPFNKITAANNSNFTKKDYEEIDRGFVAFGAIQKEGKLLGKKNNVLFTDIECVALSPDFKLTDGRGFTCLFAKATPDESNLWHRRLEYVNFKTMNKLVRGNLVRGCGPNWLFDIDALTNSMNYKPVVAGNQSNDNVGTKACADTSKARVETVPGKDYILLPLWTQDPSLSSCPKDSSDAGFKPSGEEEKKDAKDLRNESGNLTKGKYSEVPSTEEPIINQEKDDYINSINNINTASDGNSTNNVNASSSTVNAAATRMLSYNDKDVGAEADMNNLNAFMPGSPIPTTRIHKDHPDELLQFKLQKVWALVDLPNGKRAIGTKWVYRNKKDERGIVIKNKARLVAQGYTQEEGIDYDEVFFPCCQN
ncbi:putative ribonuclease H-like domain-containing protein [Tanacetum coccineum]